MTKSSLIGNLYYKPSWKVVYQMDLIVISEQIYCKSGQLLLLQLGATDITNRDSIIKNWSRLLKIGAVITKRCAAEITVNANNKKREARGNSTKNYFLIR